MVPTRKRGSGGLYEKALTGPKGERKGHSRRTGRIKWKKTISYGRMAFWWNEIVSMEDSHSNGRRIFQWKNSISMEEGYSNGRIAF
jgi:hypothetical protein